MTILEARVLCICRIRIGGIAGELGQGIREFRKGLTGDENLTVESKNHDQQVAH